MRLSRFNDEMFLNVLLTCWAVAIVVLVIHSYNEVQSAALIGMFIITAQRAIGLFYQHPDNLRDSLRPVIFMLAFSYGSIVIACFVRLGWSTVFAEAATGFMVFFGKIMEQAGNMSSKVDAIAPAATDVGG